MSNAQTDTKAASTVESKPDRPAKQQDKTSTVASASAAASKPNSKAARGTMAQAVKPSAQAKVGKKQMKKGVLAAKNNSERKRGRKPYPVVAFADVLPLAEGIMKHAAGQEVKRKTLLETMGLAETSQSTRNLITNSSKYDVTEGNHSGEFLKLTPKGLLAVDPKANPAEQRRARFDLAVSGIEEFKALYEKCKGNPLLAPRVLHDVLADVDEGDRQACVDVFTSNVKFLGLLVARDGAEYLMTVDEWVGQRSAAAPPGFSSSSSLVSDGAAASSNSQSVDYEKTCFIVSVIKDAHSPERTHADAILNQYIEKSLDGTGLKAVRADKIGEPGMISRQIIEYVIKSKLVVLDLSFHNPNVFYELALRHVTGKPTVQVTRACDKLPFDVGNARTIPIDTSDGYTMVREIDTIRSQIATAIRSALENGESRDNPILAYCPTAKFSTDGQ
jgi:hypothetical protein